MNDNILLTYEALSAVINPLKGMNTEQITYNGTDIIKLDEMRRTQLQTYSVPILFPTPNRVENGHFSFEGKFSNAKFHGIVKDAEFKILNLTRNSVLAKFEILRGEKAYENFNYECIFLIEIKLSENKISWTYTVENISKNQLPFSFAIHPFFKKYDGTSFKVDTDYVMEMNDEKLPTGNCIYTNNTPYDINFLNTPGRIQLDHVYCTNGNKQAEINHPKHNFKFEIISGDSFKKCVVYTQKNCDWFCIEPQTSSTNCHNLHSKGFTNAANLQIVLPFSKKSDTTEFVFSKLQE